VKPLKLLISPAALCIWAIGICIAYSVLGSDSDRMLAFAQDSKFGYAKISLPLEMKQKDPTLFSLLASRSKSDIAEFLKGAEQDAANKLADGDEANWKPYLRASSYIEQFRTQKYVSFIEIANITLGEAQPVFVFRTVNFDKENNRELALGDILDGTADRSRTLEALAAYARADLRDKGGEEAEEESEALLELSKPDLSVYERFTLCPSTNFGKAAGLTIHFPPPSSGPYAGRDYHVTVPYTVFAKFLKPGMRSLFAGEPRQAPVSLQDAES
jgi:hypothetical protein